LKTHSPWTYLVLDPGRYLWTSPHGYQFLRDPTGTQDISTDRPRLKPDGTRPTVETVETVEPTARPPDT
jgi:hypothetical protein